jgi:hypothetical protein
MTEAETTAFWSADAVARDINARAADTPIYRAARPPLAPGQNMAWRVAPAPYAVDTASGRLIPDLGRHLHAFYLACNRLYLDSVAGTQPAWVHEVLDQGKPSDLVAFQRLKCFRNETPRIIRPDLIQTEDGEVMICELDSIPGGIGLTAHLAADYASYGFAILGGADALVLAFAALIKSMTQAAAPSLAIVVSDESQDYWDEQVYLGDRLSQAGLRCVVIKPQALRARADGGINAIDPAWGDEIKIDLIYRFFELFDLENIPQSAMIRRAVQNGRVAVTPPYKALLEEKLLFALYQHPALVSFWHVALDEPARAMLGRMLRRTWILDPAPLPPQAVYPDLSVHPGTS